MATEFKPKLLILADQNLANQLKTILEPSFHEIIVATSCSQAIHQLSKTFVEYFICSTELSDNQAVLFLRFIKTQAKRKKCSFIVVGPTSTARGFELADHRFSTVENLEPIAEKMKLLASQPSHTRGSGLFEIPSESSNATLTFLEETGHGPVELFYTGEKIKELLTGSRANPELLVISWDFDLLSPEKIVRRIRHRLETASIPVIGIFTKGLREKEKLQTATHLSVDLMLARPFRMKEFGEKVDSVLNRNPFIKNYQESVGAAYSNLDNDLFDQAMELFRNASMMFPELAEPYKGLGECYFKLKDRPNGVKQYQKAMSLSPYDELIYLELARFLAGFELHKEAFETLGYGLDNIPTSSMIHLETGKILLQLNQNEKAKKFIERAFHLNPKNKEAQKLLGK